MGAGRRGTAAAGSEQASVAMRTADAVILVVDAVVGATAVTKLRLVSCAAPASRCSWPPTKLTARKAKPMPPRCGRWASVSHMRSARYTVAAWPICSTRSSARYRRSRSQPQRRAVHGGSRWSASPTSVRARC